MAIRDFRLSTNQNIIQSSHSQLLQIGMETTNVGIENPNPLVGTWTRIGLDITTTQPSVLIGVLGQVPLAPYHQAVLTPASHRLTLGHCLTTKLHRLEPTQQPPPSWNFPTRHFNLYPSHHRTPPHHLMSQSPGQPQS